MRHLIAYLLLTCSAVAQVQGNLPDILDSVSMEGPSQPATNQIIVPDNINVGDTIDVCLVIYNNTQYSVTDTLGNTYTLTTPTTMPRGVAGIVYHAYTQATFSGPDTITVNYPGGNSSNMAMGYARYSGLGSLDGSVAVGTYSGNSGGGIGTVSSTQTTTSNGDLLLSCAGGGQYGTWFMMPSDSSQMATWSGGPNETGVLMTFAHAGAPGSYTTTENTYNDLSFGSYTSFAVQTLAFKPSTIKVVDTVLPDAGSGVAYYAQIHGVGGSSTLTYSIVSGVLPTGLSFNTTTGEITGTTTVVGTTALGFQVTDGTVTSSTATLNLRVNSTLVTPRVKSVVPSVNETNGPWDQSAGAPNGVAVSVGCNDTLVVLVRGTDTHFSNGGIQLANGANTNVTDTFGNTWTRVPGWIAGTRESPLIAFVSSPMTVNGADIVSVTNNNGGSTANAVSLIANVGIGEVVDYSSGLSSLTNVASGSYGTSYTTLVPNTLLLAMNVTDTSGGPFPMSMAGTFSLLSYDTNDGQGTSLYNDAFIATPQTVSGTVTFSGASATYTSWSELLLPVRPAPALNVCAVATNNIGKKFRRPIW